MRDWEGGEVGEDGGVVAEGGAEEGRHVTRLGGDGGEEGEVDEF